MDLKGKKIVILGGSSGIGLATAHAAAAQGGDIVIVSSSQKRLESALAELPANVTARAIDLTNETAIKNLFAEIGALDHVAFTAGELLQLGALESTEVSVARKTFELRFWGAYATAKYAAPKIRAGGSIVFTSGMAGQRPYPGGWSMPAAICSALEGLTRALAVELAPVRVNIVCPGLVKTPFWSNMPDAARDAMYGQMEKQLLVRHAGEAEEVADAYIYAMRQSYCTGQSIVVDGGGALI